MLIQDTTLINTVWNKFLGERGYHSPYVSLEYNYTSRYHPTAQMFESWLFDQGATVRQSDGRRYLEFAIEEQASFFLLRHL